MADPTDTAITPKRALPSAAALAGIALVAALACIALAQLLNERIQRNQLAWIETPLLALLPAGFDNDPLTDQLSLRAEQVMGTAQPVTVYRARRGEEHHAIALRAIAPDGYRGPIELLVGITPAGELLGVKVLSHEETPGLGDAFENRSAGWLEDFAGLSLESPPQARWRMRRDGGDFDAFTGATITPRAIVTTVRRTLELYRSNQSLLWAAAP